MNVGEPGSANMTPSDVSSPSEEKRMISVNGVLRTTFT